MSLSWVRFRALTEAFLGRFFDSDLTSNAADLKQSFFWLMAMLGGPGILLAFYFQFGWMDTVFYHGGLAALRVTSLNEKLAYLGLAFLGVTLVASLAWRALMFDRLDGLVLGTQPVSASALAGAKLSALFVYSILLAAGAHLIAAGLFGVMLGGSFGVVSTVRIALGHLVAAGGLSVFVFLAIAALQATLCAIAGPRIFGKLSLVLQATVIVGGLAGFAMLPGRSSGLFTPPGGDLWQRPWSLMPPVWFLGVYEVVAGTSRADLHALATTALVATSIALSLVLVCYPVACARILRDVAGTTGRSTSRGRFSLVEFLVRRGAQADHDRAVMQLTLITWSRAHVHRLILLVSGAVGATAVGSALLVLVNDEWTTSFAGTRSLIGLPVICTAIWLLGCRIALGFPGEPKGAWLFEVTPVAPLAGRRTARRLLLLVGWLPLTTLTALLYFTLWPFQDAYFRTIVSGLSTLWFIEVLLWSYAAIPCVSAPAGGDQKVRIVVLLAMLELMAIELPTAELFWRDSVRGRVIMTIVMAALWYGSRLWTDRFIVANAGDDEGAVALHLDLMPPPAGSRPVPQVPRH